jgi:hypothetical protein
LAVLEALIKTYGLVAVIGVSGVAGVVWLISHFAAKPGGKVSVLWGLTTYDRRESNDVKPSSKQEVSEPKMIDSEKSVFSEGVSDSTKHVLVARIDDSLLIDSETQRASNDIVVYRKGNPLNQLAIVSLIIELQGTAIMPTVSLHLKRKRPGEILSALPQILGDVEFQNACTVTPLGIQITLRNMHPRERFRLQMLTDGLRSTDFHLVQEPRIATVELRVEKSEDWQP